MPSAAWSAHTVVQVFCSVMSFISSSLIACTVAWPSNGGFSTPFRRIIFGLSFFSILQSIALISGPWMIPRSVGAAEHDFWGIGNKATCQANGFVFTVGSTGTGLYMCLLCLYYLAKLKWKMSDKTFWHKYEKKLHLFIITYRIAVGVAALRLDTLYPGAGATTCSFSLTPYGCRHEPELVGECTNNRSTVNAFLFFDIMLSVVLLFAFTAATMIRLILHADFLMKLNAEDSSSRHHFGIDIDTELDSTRNPKTVDEISESPSDAKKENQSIGNGTLRESQSTGMANTLTQHSLEQDNDSKTGKLERQARAQAASDLSRLYFNETMLQAKLYVGCFFLTYIPVVLILIAIIASNTSSRDNSFIVTVLTFFVVFFFPLGGFLNILVYSRPNVARLRRLHPEISRLKAFWMVFRAGGGVTSGENSAQSSDNELTTNNVPQRKGNISHSTKDPFGVARTVALPPPPSRPTHFRSHRDFVDSDVAMNGLSEAFSEDDPRYRYTPPSDWSYEEGGKPDLNWPSFSNDLGEGRGKQKDETEMGRRRGGKVSKILSGLSFFSEETNNNNSNLSFASREMGLDSEDWKSETQST